MREHRDQPEAHDVAERVVHRVVRRHAGELDQDVPGAAEREGAIRRRPQSETGRSSISSTPRWSVTADGATACSASNAASCAAGIPRSARLASRCGVRQTAVTPSRAHAREHLHGLLHAAGTVVHRGKQMTVEIDHGTAAPSRRTRAAKAPSPAGILGRAGLERESHQRVGGQQIGRCGRPLGRIDGGLQRGATRASELLRSGSGLIGPGEPRRRPVDQLRGGAGCTPRLASRPRSFRGEPFLHEAGRRGARHVQSGRVAGARRREVGTAAALPAADGRDPVHQVARLSSLAAPGRRSGPRARRHGRWCRRARAPRARARSGSVRHLAQLIPVLAAGGRRR